MAWKEFKRGKIKKKDVQKFGNNFKNNIFSLHNELRKKTYSHLNYFSFYVKDPKLRHIHKACVKDRILHRAIFRILYPVFDKTFIFDSYSCRDRKGTHRAVNRLNDSARKVGRNNTKTCFILKLDIKKFFNSIDQDILINLIKKKINDDYTIWLIEKIVKSFPKGLPLGNITSQLFANVYLNELDKFIKHRLKIRYYIRYCDDFLILSRDIEYLKNLIPQIDCFLKDNLKLFLHPDKIIIKKYHQGIDFLGYVSFPYHRILRTKTRNRIFKKLEDIGSPIISKNFEQVLQSYLGVLKHCNSYKLKKEIKNLLKNNALAKIDFID